MLIPSHGTVDQIFNLCDAYITNQRFQLILNPNSEHITWLGAVYVFIMSYYGDTAR